MPKVRLALLSAATLVFVTGALATMAWVEENNRMGKTRDLFGEGNGSPLQYSCLEDPMDGGAW